MKKPEYGDDYYDRSRKLLDTALSCVPAYKGWNRFDPGSDKPVDDRYAAMPYLEKVHIRDYFPDGFVPEGTDVRGALERGEISTASTSGSSDVSATNIWNQEWWDASEQASWQLNSHSARLLTGTHHEALLSNPLNVGIVSDNTEIPMEERRVARFLYLNEMTDPAKWTAPHMDRMLHELEVFEPVLIEANPSFLSRLCKYAAEAGKAMYQPGLVTFTYEYPSLLHLKQIRRVLHCPLASSYGSTETGSVFMQCEAGKFHQNTAYNRIDFQPFKEEFGGPDIGRLLISTFHNPWYFMLRFNVRDLVRVDEEQTCSCGRKDGLILSAIEGRCMSTTVTCDGRPVTLRTLDNVIASVSGVLEYQLEQINRTEFRLHLVTEDEDRDGISKRTQEALQTLYGEEAEIKIDYRQALSPEDSGKYALAKVHFKVDIDSFIA